MLRRLILFAAFVGVFFVPCDPVHAQDQPQSLGDIARQNRKDKEKTSAAPAKTVLTDDNFGSGGSRSGASGGASSAAADLSNLASAGTSAKAPTSSGGSDDPMAKAWGGIGKATDALDRLEPLDRATLAKVVLQGNDVEFPNRRAWEERLFAAKEKYVAHSRQLLERMKDLMENAQAMRDGNGADTAQAQQLMTRAQALMSDAQNTEGAFKAVLDEGIAQAKQAAHR